MSDIDDIPLISVIATGGTIASQRGDDGASAPALAGQALLERLEGLPPVRLNAVDLFARDSSTLTLADMQAVSDAVGRSLADPKVAGVVVLHGTDSMEETMMLTQLQHGTGKPVVFTGAQFTDDHPAADGPTNMTAAIRAVLDGTPGVRLAFGGRLLPAWGISKFSTDQADAFRQVCGETLSPGGLQDARIDRIRVDLVAIHPGATGSAIEAGIASGAQGLVLVALGSGNATAEVAEVVGTATAKGIPMVITSRVPTGRLAASYGGGGGGHDLVANGAILSLCLRAGQARVLLAALIAAGKVETLGPALFSGTG